MYVDKFFKTNINSSGATVVDPVYSILGIPAKENALLQYAKENHFTYLILYNLHRVFGNATYEGYLCSFIQKAKTQYCIEKIGAASSCASMFENIAVSGTAALAIPDKFNQAEKIQLAKIGKTYEPGDSMFYLSEVAKLSMLTTVFNESCAYKIDAIVTEYEFWNSGTDNCTDETVTKDQKYQRFQTMITDMDAIRDNYNSSHSHQIIVEAYIGFLNQNTAYTHQGITDWMDATYNGKRRIDRIITHYYGTDAVKLYSRTSTGSNNSGYYLTRFLDFCQSSTTNQTSIYPLFSSEYVPWGAGYTFLGSWFSQNVNNNIFSAEKTFYDDWYNDAQNYHASTVGSATLGNIVDPGVCYGLLPASFTII